MLFRVFGVLEVHGPAGVLAFAADKPRRMLSALLLHANRWVPDDELIEAIWPAGPPPSAAGNLKSYVSQVRKLLAPVDTHANRLERQPGAYRLTVARAELDTMTFADLIGQAGAALAADPACAVALVTEALALWRGEPFESLEIEAAKVELARLTELRWSARTTLADALVAAGRHSEAIGQLRAMTTEDPLKEPTWLRLLDALDAGGRRAEALLAYQDARRVIVDELGIEPGTALRAAHQRLLAADEPSTPSKRQPAPAPPRPAPAPTGRSVEAPAPTGRLVDAPAPTARSVDAPAPTARSVPAPPPSRRRPRRSRVIVAASLALTAVLAAGLVIAIQWWPKTSGGAAITAADRYGWGIPAHAAEFSTGLDGWTPAGPRPGHEGRGQQIPERVSVRDDLVTITGDASGNTGYLTRNEGTFRGRWEARVRLPPGCACYRPLLTLWPVANDSPAGGEIVYLEVFDPERQRAQFFLSSGKYPDRYNAQRAVDLTQWNHFAVEWTEHGLTGYVNGEKWFHTAEQDRLPPRRMRPTIKLDLAQENDLRPASMEIDWIRQYPV
ncbi:BTAD domain-containing putative transcriptional regulator [Crossiella cryophila]|uniref:DNA-binding SARP family transcriptional activator n=1 Tax=Crossiella cryophila TaxID=43355 RepID=A0A7W7CI39_9PSEU|nr:BTAD domain-containing putative transcriptional regulator [Crossiella cryophila]MBB4679894.1 DNA-binding SARP family transcriptional activator [Crossiella cryophila]